MQGTEVSPNPRGAASPFSIGTPGRAALEVSAAPGPRIGHADVELSAATWRGILVRGATCRGLQHRATGQPRQDAFAIGCRISPPGDERMIAVVCDGVGSLPRSDEAATLASKRLADLGVEGVPWPQAFTRVNEEIHTVVEQALCGGNADDPAAGMATTAIAVNIHRDRDEWLGEVAWVGDSTLWHLNADSRWALITEPPHRPDSEDEYSPAQVRALPSTDGVCAFREFRLVGGALFLMTDGVANPVQWSDDVRATLAGWWASPPNPFSFAAQVDFARKSHIDDRTVVGMWLDTDDSLLGECSR